MRVIFFGTPAFAIPSLANLLSRHTVVAVVTRPDKARGRGQKVKASPVKVLAESHGVPVAQPDRLGSAEWLEYVAGLNADIAVVAAYGKILPQALLDLPRLGFINVHASLLPRWRGAAPIHRAVIAGDAVTGVTIMRVVLALDAGPMLASRSTRIDESDTSQSLEARLAVMGADLLIATMAQLEAGLVDAVPQDEAASTYAPRLERHESQIDWHRPASVIDRQIRGLQPWPLAAVMLGGKRLAFLQSSVVDAPAAQAPDAAPGTIVAASAAGLVIACQPGAVRITQVLPEGRRPMAFGAFLNGTPVVEGSVVLPLPVAARP